MSHDDATMSLTGHLTELRNRLMIMIGTVFVLFLVTYYFSTQLLKLIQRPIAGQKLVFLSPTEAFMAHLKVSFFAALFLSLPMLLYQLWRFCAPGLLQKEKRYVAPFVILSTLCFVLGALFCYFLILPYGLAFLLSFGSDILKPEISVGYYISFTFKLIFTFGLIFEVPLVTLLLVQIGVLTPQMLSSNRGYIVVGIFVMAAVLTPPDVVSQVLLAGPLLVLFEVSVLAARVIARRKKEKAAEAEAEEETG